MEALDAALGACLDVNNQARSVAEEQLKVLSADPRIVPELLSRMQAHPDAAVRQLSAVLLRKRVTRHWGGLAPGERAEVQRVLMACIASEAVHPVRRSVADVASVVAKQAVPAGEWPELLGFLEQCGGSGSEGHREVALQLFTALADNIGKYMQPVYPQLVTLVGRGLADASEPVRLAAIQSLMPLASMATGQAEVRAYHDLVGTLLAAIGQALSSGSEDVAVAGFQALVELVEVPSPLLQPHVGAVVTLCMQAGVQRALELETREQALQVVHWLARYKPRQLTKDKTLARSVVTALCEMCCEAPPPGFDDTAGVLSPGAMASQALDALACHCAPQHVHPVVIPFAKAACASHDEHARTGALNAIAVITEGCAEPLRRKLKEVLPLVLAGLADPSGLARGAAAFALGQMSEHLQPEVVGHYAAVLPALFNAVGDGDTSVQERACYALDAFCDILDDEILPFIPTLMEKLLGLLQTTQSHSMQDMALSAIASTVAAAGVAIVPYAPTLLPVMQHFMSVDHREGLPARCRATEVAGLLLSGLGKARDGGQAEAAAMLQSVAPGCMQQGLQGFELAAAQGGDAAELREYGHSLFACVAKALGPDFALYLQYVLPLAVASCHMDDGTFEEVDCDGDDGDAGPLGGISDDEEEVGGRAFNVRTGVMDEKCAAVHALGAYAEGCPAGLAPHMESVLTSTVAMARYMHGDVRASAYGALGSLMVCTHGAWPGPAEGALSPQALQVAGVVCPALVEGLEDDEKHSVSVALQALTLLLRSVGLRAFTAEQLGAVVGGVGAILAGKAACHDGDDDESDGEDEGAGNVEAEEELLAAAGDALPALAAALGADAYASQAFAPGGGHGHLAGLLQRMGPRSPPDLRSIAVGSVAEVAEVLRERMAPHLEKLVTALVRELRSEDAVNRQNAAFCVGVLCDGCGQAAAPFWSQMLQAMTPLFSPEETGETRDNAVGAVGRLILAGRGALPLEQLLPTFLGGLPLRDDLREATPAYTALAALVTSGDTAPRVLALAPQVLSAFGAAAVQPGLPAEALMQVGRAVASLQAAYAQQLGAAVASLPAEQQQGLARLMAEAQQQQQ